MFVNVVRSLVLNGGREVIIHNCICVFRRFVATELVLRSSRKVVASNICNVVLVWGYADISCFPKLACLTSNEFIFNGLMSFSTETLLFSTCLSKLTSLLRCCF